MRKAKKGIILCVILVGLILISCNKKNVTKFIYEQESNVEMPNYSAEELTKLDALYVPIYQQFQDKAVSYNTTLLSSNKTFDVEVFGEEIKSYIQSMSSEELKLLFKAQRYVRQHRPDLVYASLNNVARIQELKFEFESSLSELIDETGKYQGRFKNKEHHILYLKQMIKACDARIKNLEKTQ